MSMRRALGLIVLGGLGLLQFLALAVPVAFLLARPEYTLDGIGRLLLAGDAPLALGLSVASAIVFGSIAALLLWRLRTWGILAGLLLLPLLLPVALLTPYSDTSSELLLLMAHASQGFAFGTACGLLSLLGVEPAVLRAAACCGVSPAGALQRLLLPMMAPGILAGIVLAATASAGSSIVQALQGIPISLVAFHTVPPPIWLAAGGLALMVCALLSTALALMRRG
jgi:ABC-type spermidine/putrescine transport system permease subunit II